MSSFPFSEVNHDPKLSFQNHPSPGFVPKLSHFHHPTHFISFLLASNASNHLLYLHAFTILDFCVSVSTLELPNHRLFISSPSWSFVLRLNSVFFCSIALSIIDGVFQSPKAVHALT
jgi:hypothetical protein